MQPSPSSAPPRSSSSWSPPLAAAPCTIVVPAGQPVSPAPPPAAPAPPVEVFVPVDVEVLDTVELALAESAAVSLRPTPRSPFIPALACPGTEHKNSYFPPLVIVTVSVVDSPVFSIFVALPTQEFFAALATGVVQI